MNNNILINKLDLLYNNEENKKNKKDKNIKDKNNKLSK